jgi:phosphoenolpyruvate synthase/pyruvate phosphate dikinase
VVTADAYLEAVAESGAQARLRRLLSGLNADDHASLAETHRAARGEIMATTIPAEIADAIALPIDGSVTTSLSRYGLRNE